MFKNVLSKGKIGSVELKNRFIVPAMGSNHSEADGTVGEELIAYYTARARGGFGLIITEYVGVCPSGLGSFDQLRIFTDDFIPSFKVLSDAVHSEGAKIFMQLHHGGRVADTNIAGQPIVSASAISSPMRDITPLELPAQGVYDLIEKFGDGALRAKKAGYDGV